jgi:hypothetical protein
MSTLKGIPVVADATSRTGSSNTGAGAPAGAVRSGQKYLTAQGTRAIKDGIKAHGEQERTQLFG